jgi:nucleotide-binding universal stress UspA family protein
MTGKTVIWATDGSGRADAALEVALCLIDTDGGRVVAVHCDQLLTGRAGSWHVFGDEHDRRMRICRQVDQLRSDGFDVVLLMRSTYREPADVIAAIADEVAADVIVCGTRGLGAMSVAFLGSFTQRLLHAVRCPVLAVPQAAHVRSEVEQEGLPV